MAETKETGEKAVKFGKTQDVSLKTIEKAPKDTQQKYHAISSKGESLKIVEADVLSSSTKDDIKTQLPKAIVVKKNLKKDVEILYASFKKFKETHSNAEEIKEFKMACEKVILAAQKSHTEIKEKVYTIYDKKK
ncbi:MAG TPA: hypothetical protein EYH10_04365 [Deltaproteobacteria bacterium]|jgi:hypothetical protein|nr:hypothetical protein [Deltaproteobacteria bacterium]